MRNNIKLIEKLIFSNHLFKNAKASSVAFDLSKHLSQFSNDIVNPLVEVINNVVLASALKEKYLYSALLEEEQQLQKEIASIPSRIQVLPLKDPERQILSNTLSLKQKSLIQLRVKLAEQLKKVNDEEARNVFALTHVERI